MRTLYFNEKDLAIRQKEWRALVWREIEEEAIDFKRRMIEESLKVELSEAIGARSYERSEGRKSYRHGYYVRDFQTAKERLRGIRVPRADGGGIEFKLWGRFQRRREDFDEAVFYGFLLGMSGRDGREFFGRLYGEDVISQQGISNIFRKMTLDVQEWHRSPLDDDWIYLYADGLRVPVRKVWKKKKVILAVMGVKRDGTRQLIDFELASSESAPNWSRVCERLRDRGLRGRNLKLIIHDGADGLIEALGCIWGVALSQTCAVHHLRNLAKRVRKIHRRKLLREAARIYKAPHAEAARTRARTFWKNWIHKEPKGVRIFMKGLEATLNFYKLGWEKNRSREERIALWKSLMSTNPLERYFEEIRRRIRPMRAFRNDSSCERIFYALIEHDNQQNVKIPHLALKEIKIESLQLALT
jgi:transposase-like protein